MCVLFSSTSADANQLPTCSCLRPSSNKFCNEFVGRIRSKWFYVLQFPVFLVSHSDVVECLRYSGIWRCVTGWLMHGVSRRCTGLFVKRINVQGEGRTRPLKTRPSRRLRTSRAIYLVKRRQIREDQTLQSRRCWWISANTTHCIILQHVKKVIQSVSRRSLFRLCQPLALGF